MNLKNSDRKLFEIYSKMTPEQREEIYSNLVSKGTKKTDSDCEKLTILQLVRIKNKEILSIQEQDKSVVIQDEM